MDSDQQALDGAQIAGRTREQGDDLSGVGQGAKAVARVFSPTVASIVGEARPRCPLNDVDNVLTVDAHLRKGTNCGSVERIEYMFFRNLALSQQSPAVGDVARRNRIAVVDGKDTAGGNQSLWGSSTFEGHLVRWLGLTIIRWFDGDGQAGMSGDQVADALLRLSAVAADEIAFLDEEVARLWPGVVQQREGAIILDRKGFRPLPPALQRHLLRAAIDGLLGSLKDIETRHIEEIMAVLDKPAGKQVSLPGGLVFAVEYERYLLGRGDFCPFPPLEGEFTLNVPGETQLPGWRVSAAIIEPGRVAAEGGFVGHLDMERARGELMVRCGKQGDRFYPLGLGHPKKLGQFMIDAKIPRAWRRRIPVVFSAGQILWLVGYRLDDSAKVTGKTGRVLRLEFTRV